MTLSAMIAAVATHPPILEPHRTYYKSDGGLEVQPPDMARFSAVLKTTVLDTKYKYDVTIKLVGVLKSKAIKNEWVALFQDENGRVGAVAYVWDGWQWLAVDLLTPEERKYE